MVRDGPTPSSKSKSEKLSTGALIEQLDIKGGKDGERLKYKLLEGTGPEEGWVGIALPGKTLCVKTLKRPGGTAAASVTEETVAAAEEAAKRPEWAPIPPDIWETFPKITDAGSAARPTTMKAFKEVVNTEAPGDYWGITFPFSPKMLKEMGPKWLTKAMHLTGSMPKDNEVIQFVEMDVKAEDVSKQDAENAKWGGAGLKILLKVKYKNGPSPTLGEGMFIKMPHEFTGKNERYKNSVTSFGMDWSEVTFYNVFGGRFGDLPFKSPRMYFCDICRKTTNFVNIVERIPYAKTGTMKVAPGEYFPAPEKYRDWALPNNGIDLYYAHVKALAQFFGWHRKLRESTDQVEKLFMDEGTYQFKMNIFAEVAKSGPYNSKERDAWILEALKSNPHIQGFAGGAGFPPQVALGFFEMCKDFMNNGCPQAWPKEFLTTHFQARWVKEATRMAKYCAEMNAWSMLQPEYFALCHPNAQVDNAFYWKSAASGEVVCGLLDWGGVNHSTITSCLGNGWIGAEPEVFVEHEEKIVQCFVDEFCKACEMKFDVEDLLMHIKCTQGSVFYGCCANIGMLLRIHKKDEWKTMKGRMDPRIDENFLLRCYFVQIHLWLKLWQTKSGPYPWFEKFMKRTNLPEK